MMLAELQHADKVEGMFAEAMSDKTYLEHYGVQGMRWGVRKERETSGRKRSSSVKEVTSDQKKLSTGQKAALAVIGTIVLRKNVGKLMKYGTRDGIRRMKALAKIEAKYGGRAVTQTANRGLTSRVLNFGMKSPRSPKTISGLATAGKNAGKNAGKGAGTAFQPLGQKLASEIAKNTTSRWQRAKNLVKNLLSSRAGAKQLKSKGVVKSTKKTSNVIDNAKKLRETRRKYRAETKRLAKEAEQKARNTINQLEHNAKMQKLMKQRRTQLHNSWSPYTDTIRGMTKNAKKSKAAKKAKMTTQAYTKKINPDAKVHTSEAAARAKVARKQAKAKKKANYERAKEFARNYDREQRRKRASDAAYRRATRRS